MAGQVTTSGANPINPSDRPAVSEDAEIEAAADAIETLLYLVPPEKRAAVLACARRCEEAAAAERAKHGPFRLVLFDALVADYENTRDYLYRREIDRFAARLAYTLIRNITNNHSDKDAGALLFNQLRGVSGSGNLIEYLGGLPVAPEVTVRAVERNHRNRPQPRRNRRPGFARF